MSRTIHSFSYSPLPSRVIFGAGRRAEIADEVKRAGCKRPLIITSYEQRYLGEQVAQQFEPEASSIFDGATMHTPWEVTQRALDQVKAEKTDCVIAIGGGSAIGLSKAIALQTDLPQIAVPTTYAGSEVTPIIGETRDNEKRTQRTLKVLPEVVIYDVELTLSLPASISAASGLNAIAHAVEALYAQDSNPVTSLMAEEGIAALASSLPEVVTAPSSVFARRTAQYGAWLCGICLGTVGMGLHHKICHVLGGTFNLPHAQTHAVMIAHVASYNAHAAPHAMASVARALEADSAWAGLFELARELRLPMALKDLGMPKEGIDRVVELVMQNSYSNPRPANAEALRTMLERAWSGLPASPIE